MKKVAGILLGLFFLTVVAPLALAAERIVQLTIPGCATWGSKGRIGSILKKIDGVKKHENKGDNLLIVTFDDEKTTIGIIKDELKKGKFTFTGEPIYLK